MEREQKEKKKIPQGRLALVGKGFDDNVVHRKAPAGEMITEIVGGHTYFSYRERSNNGQYSLINSDKNFQVRLSPTELDLVRYVQTLFCDQIKDIKLYKKQANLESIICSSKIVLDFEDYAILKGGVKKEVQKETLKAAESIAAKDFHYLVSYYDQAKKSKAIFEVKDPIFKIGNEVNPKTGRKVMRGKLLLDIPLNTMAYMIKTSHFNYIPNLFWQIPNTAQTAKYLADACVNRYYENKGRTGKDGKSFWLLETAMKEAGLLSSISRSSQRGKAEKYAMPARRSLQYDFNLFKEAVAKLTGIGFLDKEDTFLAEDLEGKRPLDWETTKPSGKLYFHFRILGIEDKKELAKLVNKNEKTKAPLNGGVSQGINPDEPEP